MIADFDEAVSGLVPEASTNRFEQSLAELGTYLGFETQRPDHQFWIGPDVLWIAPDPHDFVIEAKSHKEAYNPLYKGDHAQLLEAEHWYKTTYPNRAAVRVSALREAAADAKASTAGTMALTLDALARLSGAVRRLLEELVVEEGDEGAIQRRCEALLITNSLTPDALKKCFLVPFDDPLAPLRSARHPLVGSAAQ